MDANVAVYNPDKELEFQIQLGGKLYPEYPVKSISEAFCILKQTLNLPDWGLHSVGIDYTQYISKKNIFAMSFEKVPEASWTGTNTKTGQILLIKLNAVNTSPDGAAGVPGVGGAPATLGNIADLMFATLMTENILEVRDSGVSVYD